MRFGRLGMVLFCKSVRNIYVKVSFPQRRFEVGFAGVNTGYGEPFPPRARREILQLINCGFRPSRIACQHDRDSVVRRQIQVIDVRPFFSTSVSSFSEAPRGRFSPRSHWFTRPVVTFM